MKKYIADSYKKLIGGVEKELSTIDDIPLTISTAFVNKTYASSMSLAYDEENPNIEIDITGNLSLTITGTVNGDSGLINLYFSGNQVATLNGFTNLVITGSSSMIPVLFIHDTDGLKWYNNIDMNLLDAIFAKQDNTRLYHNIKWFTPTGTISTSGTTATSTTGQFLVGMVGSKLTINGESKIITAFTSTTVVTVASAYNTNYVAVATGNWGVYSESLTVTAGEFRMKTPTGSLIHLVYNNGSIEISTNLTGFGNIWNLGNGGLILRSNSTLKHSSTAFSNGATDIGLRRNSAGVYEIFDGVNATGLEADRRDLWVRNLISKSNVYANDAAADADATLPSGAFYKITGLRAVMQKP